MNSLETEWWTVAIPPEWWADAEEESILIGDRDAVGCIEITTLHSMEDGATTAVLTDFARESSGDLDWQDATPGDFGGVSASSVEEGTALREWYVAAGGLLLYITYSCDEENRGMDDPVVDDILDTLVVLPTRK